jgi:hypothetical protein
MTNPTRHEVKPHGTITTMANSDKHFPHPDPVGGIELAERLHIRPETVHRWWQRSLLPEPDYPSVNGVRAWEWATILRWAGETGRIRPEDPLSTDFAILTGERPAKYDTRGPARMPLPV